MLHVADDRLDGLETMLWARREEGQRELANAIRTLVEQAVPDARDELDALPDDALLHPSLFTYFAAERSGRPLGMPLEQLLVGAVPATMRPTLLEGVVDDDGYVSLPGIGDLDVGGGPRRVVLAYRPEADEFRLAQGLRPGPIPTDPLSLRREPAIPGTEISVPLRACECIRHCFADAYPRDTGFRMAAHASQHLATVAKSLSLIHHVFAPYHAALISCLRRIVLFVHPEANSFATLGAHGAVFLNLRHPATVPFFLDELTHQGGHVVFNAQTVRRLDFVRDPTQSLSAYTEADEHRTVYDALHGLYTEWMMVEVMRRVDEGRLLAGDDGLELRGRLAFIAAKWQKDVVDVATVARPAFTPLGQAFCDRMRAECHRLVQARPDLGQWSLRGQPYEFSREIFWKANPTRVCSQVSPLPGPSGTLQVMD